MEINHILFGKTKIQIRDQLLLNKILNAETTETTLNLVIRIEFIQSFAKIATGNFLKNTFVLYWYYHISFGGDLFVVCLPILIEISKSTTNA